MTDAPRIVSGLGLPEEVTATLDATGSLVAPKFGDPAWGDAELARHSAGADALIVTITHRIDGDVLDQIGPQLRVVANVGVGYNNIDVDAASERGVRVTNTPDVLTDATADLALGLMLSATRRIGEGDRLIRRREPWNWAFDFMWGAGLQGATLGIVGLGRIGLAMARRAHAVGMAIVAAGGRGDEAVEEELGITRVGMDELFAESDVVSLHCPLTDQTHHLVNAERLRTMKAGAYLINTARGPVVDEAALVDALTSGEIAGAGLDVFEFEPAVTEELTRLENVTLLPHLGSATRQVRTRMASLAAENVIAALGQRPLPTAVN